MKLSDFDYSLPKNRIAQYPLDKRDSSRLMLINRKHAKISHTLFSHITESLFPGDILVLNNTKVIQARLYGVKSDDPEKKVEILLLRELGRNTWEALVKGIKQGKVILSHGINADVSRINGAIEIRFNIDSRVSGLNSNDIKNYLNMIGVMPLPPYIKRKSEPSDTERYQTVYAEHEGAVAAPTAGLHFTDSLLNTIKAKGVEVKTLTLQVGYGTFKPVLTADIKNHQMDKEVYEIPRDTADAVNLARSEGRRVIAVGTTVTRALEASASESDGNPVRKKDLPGFSNGVTAGRQKASIFICPGYQFKVIDALITNFHQPKSTPLMLTSAFAGLKLLKDSYMDAVNRGYRLFSYGDAMLII